MLLSRIGMWVQALDFSERMLQQARAKLAHVDNVVFSLTDMTSRWPCEDLSADLVSCNLILEHLKDLTPVFAEAARVLVPGGWLFVCELHPFRQYQGTVANYKNEDQIIQIPAFVHHISDFLEAARACGLTLQTLQEWWHEKDAGKPPRQLAHTRHCRPKPTESAVVER